MTRQRKAVIFLAVRLVEGAPEVAQREPTLLESGRLACIPVWEQDLMEQNARWQAEIDARRAGFKERTEQIIAQAISRP